MKEGSVSIVGAGCGKADLITVRGYNRLKACDAVIYDDLIDKELLSVVSDETEKIYVGKRSGKCSSNQADINELLIAKACEGKTVVRLKGGDPFVFGRGGEEAMALREAGVRYEVIPGVSSPFAIPELEGIPVTHRGMSRSVHIFTGNTADDDFDFVRRLKACSKPEATIIVLMGLSKLKLIVDTLLEAGMPEWLPVAVISGGNSPNPACYRSTLAGVKDNAYATGVASPAVIVIGYVAAMSLKCEKPQH